MGDEPRFRDLIAEVESRRVPMKGAHRSLTYNPAMLLRVERPAWFWSEVALVAGMILFAGLQNVPLLVAALVALVAVSVFVDFAFEDWVEVHNARIDREIARLRDAEANES